MASIASDSPSELKSNSLTWGMFWLLVLAATVPMLIPYFLDMWVKDWYRYFPFAIIAIAGFTYARSDHRFYPPRSKFQWGLVVAGLLMVCVSALLQQTWFASLGLFMVGTAFLASMRGPRDSSLIVLAVPLMMLIRLPFPYDSKLVNKLQEITTWLSSVVLDICHAPNAIAGNVIQLSNRELFVAEACSGIQSVFTLAFIACLLIAINRRRVWLVGFYLLMSLFLAVAANVIRVSMVALGEVYLEIDLASGWQHEVIGYFALTIAVLFLLSFDQLMVTTLHGVAMTSENNPFITAWNFLALRDEEGQEIESGSDNVSQPVSPVNKRFSGLLSYGVIGVAATIMLFSSIQIWRSKKPESFVTSSKQVVFHPTPQLVSDNVANLNVLDHQGTRGFANPRLGANSDVWRCAVQGDKADSEIDVQFVLSQPHTGWHELCDCYERLDWTLVHRKITRDTTVKIEDQDPAHVLARFKRGSQFGYLFFAGIGSNGELVPAPASLTAFIHRVWNRIDTSGVWEQNEVIMLQLWVTSPTKLSPETLTLLEDDFKSARTAVASEVKRQSTGTDVTVLGDSGTRDFIAHNAFREQD